MFKRKPNNENTDVKKVKFTVECSEDEKYRDAYIELFNSVLSLDKNKLCNFIGSPDGELLTSQIYTNALRKLMKTFPGNNKRACNIAEQLILKSVDINVEASENFLPLCFAIEIKDMGWIAFFVEHGATINISRESNRPTPLQIATMHGSKQIITYLIENGGDICSELYHDNDENDNDKDGSNKSFLLDIARVHKHDEIFKYLFETTISMLILIHSDIEDENINNNDSEGTEPLTLPSITSFTLRQCAKCTVKREDLIIYMLNYVQDHNSKNEQIIDVNIKGEGGKSINDYIALYGDTHLTNDQNDYTTNLISSSENRAMAQSSTLKRKASSMNFTINPQGNNNNNNNANPPLPVLITSELINTQSTFSNRTTSDKKTQSGNENQKLLQAAITGNINDAKIILDNLSKPLQVNNGSTTFLHTALKNNQWQFLKAILETNYDLSAIINVKDANNYSKTVKKVLAEMIKDIAQSSPKEKDNEKYLVLKEYCEIYSLLSQNGAVDSNADKTVEKYSNLNEVFAKQKAGEFFKPPSY